MNRRVHKYSYVCSLLSHRAPARGLGDDEGRGILEKNTDGATVARLYYN
jgi:hypothetical protein